MPRTARHLVLASVLLVPLAVPRAASAVPVKCQQAILKESAKLAQTRATVLAKCEEQRTKGKLTGSCPDAKSAAKLAKAAATLAAKIAKACGGKDKVCGGDATGEDTPGSIGWPGVCPNFESLACANTITTCGDVSACLACVDDAAIDQLIGLVYPETPAVPVKSPANKCQVAIGKNIVKLAQNESKTLQKCWDARLKQKHGNACPDPGDGKAVGAIAKARSKARAGICKACGGADKACGGSDDLTPAEIGLAATCPAVHVPGGADCGALGTIDDLDGLVSCLTCVAEFKVACADRLQVPALAPYPSECNPVAGTPTPTPTFTPGGGGATPTPTVTSTPAGGGCPTTVQIDGDQTGLDLDFGWDGGSYHDMKNSPFWHRLTLGFSSCENASPPCGLCQLAGPIANAGGDAFANRRCVGDTSITCAADADCGASGPCHFFLSPPVPLGRSVLFCFTTEITAAVNGGTDPDTGFLSATIPLRLKTYLEDSPGHPCPRCVSGQCVGGARNGLACTASATSVAFGDVLSFDCPPSSPVNSQDLSMLMSTTTQTRTLTASYPNCRAAGFTSQKCFCDTCATAGAEPCFTSGDCPGHAACDGSTLGGAATRPDGCAPPDGAPDGCQTTGDEGQCVDGPVSPHCGSGEEWRSCFQNSDCPLTNDCVQDLKECFGGNGTLGQSVTATGAADPPTAGVGQPTLGALFCMRPASSPAINTAFGFPGLGRIHVPVTATYN